MKITNLYHSKYWFFIVLLLSLIACKKDDEPVKDNEDAYFVQKKFIWELTETYYYWVNKLPLNPDLSGFDNPYELFDSLKYTPDDRWSFVIENYQELQNSIDGIEKTMGYQLKLFKVAGSNQVFAVVEYVFANSPAATAGMERGNVIVKINGTVIDTSNYSGLFSLTSYNVALATLSEGVLTETGVTKSLVAIEMTINPVLLSKIIDVNGKKVGYLLYSQFIENYKADLERVFANFKMAGVSELVLDFRFNPGGYLSTCLTLASMAGPSGLDSKPFLYFEWNSLLNDYFLQREGEDSPNLKMVFQNHANNLGLSRVFILTSSGTASASEMIITSLKPYMNVVLIGETTHGKYTSAYLFNDVENATNLWGLYLVTSKMLNANKEMNFKDGFVPDYPVEDTYNIPLGDSNEPLLAKAIEIVSGTVIAKSKSEKRQFEYLTSIGRNKVIESGILLNNVKLKK